MKRGNKVFLKSAGTLVAAAILLFFLCFGLTFGMHPDAENPIARKYGGDLPNALYEKSYTLRTLIENGGVDSDELVILLSKTEYSGDFDETKMRDEDGLKPILIRDASIPKGTFFVKQYAVRAFQGNRDVSELVYLPHETNFESGVFSLKRSVFKTLDDEQWGVAVPDSLIALYSDYEELPPAYFSTNEFEPVVAVYCA